MQNFLYASILMKNKTLNLHALLFYGFLCGALAVVFMISFQHFESFYQPQIIATQKYVSAKTNIQNKKAESLTPQKVTFSYASPTAKEVQVVGDFNAWGAYPLALNKSGNDIEIFTLTLALPTGKYKYYFLVDGEITLDNSALQIYSEGKTYNILEVK